MKASIRDYGTADHTTHDLAIARAERDAWQSTCEELHRTIAGRDVEIEAHLGRCEAMKRDATVKASQRDTFEHESSRLRAELAAIRDLVAPGNPQGTVVDAVRARLDAVENAQAFGIRERDAAIARAEKAESDLAELTVTRDRLLAREHEDGRLHAQLRVELAELRARPVLTEDLLRGALDAHGHAALTRKLFAHLGPVALPSPDRAEELCRAYHDRMSIDGKPPAPAWNEFSAEARVTRVTAMRLELTALAKLSPDPAREVAPTLVAVSDEDLGRAVWSKYNNADPAAWPNITIGVRAMWTAAARAVRAKLGAAEVTEERVKAALCEHFKYEGHRDWSADARAILAYLRATAAKGG